MLRLDRFHPETPPSPPLAGGDEGEGEYQLVEIALIISPPP